MRATFLNFSTILNGASYKAESYGSIRFDRELPHPLLEKRLKN